MGISEEDDEDRNITCMYKYKFENNNGNHDLRLQVWNLDDPISAVKLSFKLISVAICGLLIYTTV